jgi:hypothetical protein
VKDPASGLPSASLVADTAWQPALLARAGSPACHAFGGTWIEVWRQLESKTGETEYPQPAAYWTGRFGIEDVPRFRVSTVHKVKGESIGGVLYICNRSHLDEMLGGTATEVGKIGYVALTRARDLFVLGVLPPT